MKKLLSTALILGALYGTANSAPITSPIYMPEAGKFLTDLSIGYTKSSFDKVPKLFKEYFTDELEKSTNIIGNGKYGLIERVSLNYGFNFDFSRKNFGGDYSAEFTNFYVGLTGRILNKSVNKIDLILNVGQEENILFYLDNGLETNLDNQVYIDLAFRYGLDFNIYNLGLSINAKYVNEQPIKDNNKVKRDFSFGFTLENEFIIGNNFTIGIDLFYKMFDEIKYEDENNFRNTKAYNEYGFNLDANYAVTQNNFIGVYFSMAVNDMDLLDKIIEKEKVKDVSEQKFGVKLTSKF